MRIFTENLDLQLSRQFCATDMYNQELSPNQIAKIVHKAHKVDTAAPRYEYVMRLFKRAQRTYDVGQRREPRHDAVPICEISNTDSCIRYSNKIKETLGRP